MPKPIQLKAFQGPPAITLTVPTPAPFSAPAPIPAKPPVATNEGVGEALPIKAVPEAPAAPQEPRVGPVAADLPVTRNQAIAKSVAADRKKHEDANEDRVHTTLDIRESMYEELLKMKFRLIKIGKMHDKKCSMSYEAIFTYGWQKIKELSDAEIAVFFDSGKPLKK